MMHHLNRLLYLLPIELYLPGRCDGILAQLGFEGPETFYIFQDQALFIFYRVRNFLCFSGPSTFHIVQGQELYIFFKAKYFSYCTGPGTFYIFQGQALFILYRARSCFFGFLIRLPTIFGFWLGCQPYFFGFWLGFEYPCFFYFRA